jgi:hypothetical protein
MRMGRHRHIDPEASGCGTVGSSFERGRGPA